MLFKGELPKDFTFLSIDPGTDCCGFSVIKLNDNDEPKVIASGTMIAKAPLKWYRHEVELYGEKFVRIMIIKNHFKALLLEHSPSLIVCEAPFLGRFPAAFKGLTEITFTLKNESYITAKYTPFIEIDPKSVKRSVGVKASSKDKEDMRKALKRQLVDYAKQVKIDALDEHSIDSICVGLWYLYTQH